MATAAEITLFEAVNAAEAARQVAYAAAFTTWAFGQGGAFTTYWQALATADQNFILAVKNAAATAGLTSTPYDGRGVWPGTTSGVSPNNPPPGAGN